MSLTAAASRPRGSRFAHLYLLLLLTCCEHGELARDAGSPPLTRDAGSPASKQDAGKSTSMHDAGQPTRPDNPRDSATDAADTGSETCVVESMPRWPDLDEAVFATATRVPLAILCNNVVCPQSLAAYSSGLRCTEAEADAGPTDTDAGLCTQQVWLRRQGCGSVQFESGPCTWPRYFDFDANTGELIGAAQLDDIFTPLRGTTCRDAGYVAGKLLGECPGETVSVCVPER